MLMQNHGGLKIQNDFIYAEAACVLAFAAAQRRFCASRIRFNPSGLMRCAFCGFGSAAAVLDRPARLPS